MIAPDGAPVDFISTFEARADELGDHLAIICGGDEITYGSLNQRANFLAEQLGINDTAVPQLVGVALQQGVDRIVAVLAALKAGYGYILIDVTVLDEHIIDLIERSRCVAVVCSENDVDRYEKLANGLCQVALVDARQGPKPTENPRRKACHNQIDYVRLTSGSTGSPKWVIHNQISSFVLGENFIDSNSLQENDRVTLFNGFWHSLVHGVLAAGATLCLYDLQKNGFDKLRDWLKETGVTVIALFPSAFRRFCATLDQADAVPTIRQVVLSGETMLASDLALVRNCFGPRCKLQNAYACSELAHISCYTFDDDEEIDESGAPAGYPMDGLRISIDKEPDDPDEIGEIVVYGSHVSSGYWGREDLNKRTYLTDDATGEITGFRTGDVGWVDDRGCLFVTGRRDRQVKVNGFRVQLSDVEASLLNYPDINAAAIKSFPTDFGDNRLVAYIIPDNPALSQSELRLYLAGKLPHYMLPDTYLELESLPLLANGKVKYSDLEEPQDDELNGQTVNRPQTYRRSYVAPRDSVEQGMSVIWERILKISPIGITDNFFEFGGDSLGATQAVLEMQKALGLRADLADIYEYPTIEKLVPATGDGDRLRPIVIPLNNKMSGSPLFFVCGVSIFQTLAGELDLNEPIIAIDVPDEIALIGSRRDNYTSVFDVPKLAKAYVDAILQLQSDGPFRLAGLSFGGTVAVEIASQLMAAGKTVELVILLDALLPDSHKFSAGSWLRANYKKMIDLRFMTHKIYNKTKQMVQGKVFKDTFSEEMSYTFPENLKVVLVKAQGWSEWRTATAPDYGWSARLQHEVDVIEVPGKHIEIVQHPNVSELVSKIRGYL